MAAGTISRVAVLRDARILRQELRSALLRTRLTVGYPYDSNFGNAALQRIPVDLIHLVVMRGLDPRIHHVRKNLCEADGPAGQARG